MLNLSDAQLSLLQHLLSSHVPDVKIWAFGSRVKGTAKAWSDLDLALVAKQVLPQQQLFKLQDALEESDLPFKVDLVDWHDISTEFQQLILKNYHVIQEGE
jgi:predicted nucleotidyltransferase